MATVTLKLPYFLNYLLQITRESEVKKRKYWCHSSITLY